jgi:C-terminal processing protease CtpA/Prc
MDNQSLEGVGVIPDILAPYDLSALKQQEDSALIKARTHILLQSGDR